MATMAAGTPFPGGHDFAPHSVSSSLDTTVSPSSDLESYEEFERRMTRIHHDVDQDSQMQSCADSPDNPLTSEPLSPDKVDGYRHGKHRAASLASQGTYSLSPAGASNVLTPTSTNNDNLDTAGYDDPESEIVSVSVSPRSSLEGPVDTFVYGDSFEAYPGAVNRRMNFSRPAPITGDYLTMSRPLRETSVLLQTPTTQWPVHSFPSVSDASMDHHYNPYNTLPGDLDFTGTSFGTDALFNAQLLQDSFPSQAMGAIPFRPRDNGSMSTPMQYGAQSMLPQATANFPQYMPAATTSIEQWPEQPFSYHQPTSATLYQGRFDVQNYPGMGQHTGRLPQPQSTLPSNAAARLPQPALDTRVEPSRQMRTSPSTQTHRQFMPQFQHGQAISSASKYPQAVPSSSRSPTISLRTHTDQVLQVAQASHHQRVTRGDAPQPTIHRSQASQSDRVRKGGRSKNSHLNEQSRQKSHKMRTVGACWRCVMQRDPCDEGSPCNRCSMRSQRGQAYYFECDRSKLPDFAGDFAPPSMVSWHARRTIEDTVAAEVQAWVPDNAIDLYLSCGYGPPLRWKVYEFKPRTPDLLGQIQYTLDKDGKGLLNHFKYSPPFGLMKLEMSDDAQIEAYLDQLMEPHILMSFGWRCYEEEEILGGNTFPMQVVEMMCSLYLNTTDTSLRVLLRDILRMLIINYIMNHTLSISEDTLYTVLSSVRYSRRPSTLQRYTSPRLASRQLKFFICILRNNLYEKILKWQQASLHSSTFKKDASWLQSFCVILGFAMVLEEVQRTSQLQADTDETRGTLSHDAAYKRCEQVCQRIDERFKLLVGLFQCKYRDKTWGSNGSFGPGTPELREPVQREFLGSLRALVEQKYDHLKVRAGVEFREDQFHLYTTRLTARFLLPFLNLPAT